MDQNATAELIYGVEAMRRVLGIGHDKIMYLLHEEPGFPAFRLGDGGVWMVRRSDLMAWLDGIKTLPGKTYRFT